MWEKFIKSLMKSVVLEHVPCPLQAVAFLEPGSTNFKEPLGFPIPALSYGTQFCTETPKCCLPGFSYVHYYSLLTCPKILMNVTVSEGV